MLAVVPTTGWAATQVVDDDGMAAVGDCDAATPAFSTIQAAVTAAGVNDTVLVCPGTYTENVTINKNLSLLSTDGQAMTTIQGISGVGALGAVRVTSNTTAAQIGDAGQGFTIIGIDNGAPGLENAAVYFQGSHSNAQIRHNDIVANGDHGLLTEFGATISGFMIDNNTFSGQTFLGAQPAGIGFSMQFTLPNVPRQCVVMGGGSGGGNTSNVTFTNNTVTCTAGGISSDDNVSEQGNNLATLDTNGGTVMGNTFAGTTARFATSLRTRGPSTTISGNMFDSSGLTRTTGHVFLQNIGTTTGGVAAANTFDKGVYVDAAVGTIGLSVELFVEGVPSGTTVNVLPGMYMEEGQIVVSGDVDLVGTDQATTIISPNFDTGSGGDTRGFFLVNAGVTFNLNSVTIDGTGRKIWQAIRQRGQGSVTDVAFNEIKFDANGPSYAGTAVAAFGTGNVDVTNSTFSEIGRIGVQYFGPGITGSTFSGNTYTGKGVGDQLDYALDVNNGAVVDVTDNTVSGNRGIASSDESTSAGFLVTTFFGLGTTVTLTNNDISDNTTGIAVGFDGNDASMVTANFNNITDNDNGITSTNPSVDGVCNWWGDASGPSGAGPGTGDSVTAEVTFNPWSLVPDPVACTPLAQFEKQQARDELAALLPTGNSKADKSIEKAIEAIDKSLAPGLFIDPNHLDPKDGHKVFNEEKKAVKELEKARDKEGIAAVQSAIDHLLAADEILGTVARDEAQAACDNLSGKDQEKCQKEIDKANEELQKAADEATAGNADKAIDHYKKAWEKAQKALKKAGDDDEEEEEEEEASKGAVATPATFTLAQNYPNPFNPVTTISYALPEGTQVRVRVYNVLGQEVGQLVNRFQQAGQYEVQFDASALSSGTYFYVIEAGTFVATKSMVLMK